MANNGELWLIAASHTSDFKTIQNGLNSSEKILYTETRTKLNTKTTVLESKSSKYLGMKIRTLISENSCTKIDFNSMFNT